jgi:Uma2 family endonuclease
LFVEENRSMATVAQAETLLTAERYAERPDPGYLEELVRGRVVPMVMPKPRHGYICNKAGRIFGNFVEEHHLGWVFNNDCGVITERNPDTVRGADVAFYSFDRLPPGELPDSYSEVAPELVIEVRSPGDRRPSVLAKVAEYLEVGVFLVVVLDDKRRTAHLFDGDGTHQMLGPEDDLALHEILGAFRVAVRSFFD